MRRFAGLVAVIAVFAVVGLSVAIGNAVGMPVGYSAPFGVFVVGVTAVSLCRALGDREHPVVGLSVFLLLIAAVGAAITGKQTWPQVNALLFLAGAILVEVATIALLSGLLTVAIRASARSRHTRQRRRLADSRGWRFERSNADLPSALGGTEYFMGHIHDELLVVEPPRRVPEQARAYDAVSGEVGGVEFVAFDFFVPGRVPVSRVTTAWLVRLPHALPLFTSAEIVHAPDGLGDTLAAQFFGFAERGDSATVANPDYARAVMTDEVVTLTRQRLRSWWVDGDILAATAHVKNGAGPDLLASNIDTITRLATLLTSARISRFAMAGTRESHG
jgi:hypothetical protein